jgi:hypothetical protein
MAADDEIVEGVAESITLLPGRPDALCVSLVPEPPRPQLHYFFSVGEGGVVFVGGGRVKLSEFLRWFAATARHPIRVKLSRSAERYGLSLRTEFAQGEAP